VEQIVQERIYPEAQIVTPSTKLPNYWLTAFVLSIVFTVIGLGARVVAQVAQPPPNPLTVFADMLPGKSGSGLEARGFSCYWENDEYQIAKQHCAMPMAAGVFASVGIVVSKDQIIQYATFMLRPNTLLLGDLMLTLGKPTFHRYGESVEFSWPASGVTASGMVGRRKSSPFVPLWIVSFTSP
jgi:hypothetical protein